MARTREIAVGDLVELTEPVESAPASAITDVLEDDKAIVELTSLPLEPALDRIMIVPVSKLRFLS